MYNLEEMHRTGDNVKQNKKNSEWQMACFLSCIDSRFFKKDKTKDRQELFGKQERLSDQWEAGKYEQSAFSIVTMF